MHDRFPDVGKMIMPVGFIQIVPIMTWILDSEFCAWFGLLAFILTGVPDAKTSLQGMEQIKWAENEEEILTEQMQGLAVPVIPAKNRSKKESRLSIGQTGVMLHTSNVMKLTTITQCPWLLMKNNFSNITGEANINRQIFIHSFNWRARSQHKS